jgi:hypothetical protein
MSAAHHFDPRRDTLANLRSVQLAFSNPKPGREQDFNRWYDDEHLPEVIANRGYVSGQRFRLSAYQRPYLPPSRHSYLTVYELEGELQELFAARDAAAAGHDHSVAHHETVNPDFFGFTGYLWTPMGPPQHVT